jgi:hypothetical protein
VLDRIVVDVGAEDLDPGVHSLLREELEQGDREGVRLLAGGASGDPGADGGRLIPLREQPGKDLGFERFVRLGVAEEAGDRDQHVLVEGAQLLLVGLHEADVVLDPRDLVQRHAPLDAAIDGCGLVAGKIVAERRADEDEQLAELVLDVRRALGFLRCRPQHPRELGDPRQLLSDLLRRQAEVGGAAGERAPRHAVVFGGRRVLDEGDPPGRLDRLQAEGAVRTRP